MELILTMTILKFTNTKLRFTDTVVTELWSDMRLFSIPKYVNGDQPYNAAHTQISLTGFSTSFGCDRPARFCYFVYTAVNIFGQIYIYEFFFKLLV